MSIIVRDKDLEKKVDMERRRRGHKTKSKTLSALAIERLTELESEKRFRRAERQAPEA